MLRRDHHLQSPADRIVEIDKRSVSKLFEVVSSRTRKAESRLFILSAYVLSEFATSRDHNGRQSRHFRCLLSMSQSSKLKGMDSRLMLSQQENLPNIQACQLSHLEIST
jgi:hypothetical protein